MQVQPVPVTFLYGGKKQTIVGQKFNPAGRTMYRFWVELKDQQPIAIILYQPRKPGEVFTWYFENRQRNNLAKIISKALEKQLS